MKKVFFLTSLVLCAYVLQAQTLIPRVGLTLSKIHSDLSLGEKPAAGLMVGVGYAINLSNALAIQPEISFVQKGAKGEVDDFIEFEGTSVSIANRTRLDYLELPVLLKFTVGSEKIKMHYIGGPALAMCIGGKAETRQTMKTPNGSNTESETYGIKFGDVDPEDEENAYIKSRFDFGFQIGTGITIMEKVQIEFRYSHSFVNLASQSEFVERESKATNRVLQFSVGIPIRFN
ncbi:porin family protein [Pseudochryseolinea flava]|uniref:Outer membrane protein beta-barrel domain-containing protein n=1 Tax=Pseudochryseolinea flava TaxID=2059302 RepID=A0A364XZ99_9BACT|nr:porin family protein [Pseudochryseolinea flava]RAV99129.1 hypothetical protein DQQ10_21280 [Pseudochryseolinea flava]